VSLQALNCAYAFVALQNSESEIKKEIEKSLYNGFTRYRVSTKLPNYGVNSGKFAHFCSGIQK